MLLAPPRGSRSPGGHSRALLGSDTLQETLEQLRTKHDLIVVDTPPVLAVPDVLTMAQLADQVVMLVTWRLTSRSEVLSSLKMLRRAQAPLVGIVLSKVDLKKFRPDRWGSQPLRKDIPGLQLAMPVPTWHERGHRCNRPHLARLAKPRTT